MASALPQPVALDAVHVTRLLAAAAVAVVAASTVALFVCHAFGRSPHDVRLAQFFYVDGERNIPTLFSVLLLGGAAALLALVARLTARRGARDVGYWTVLAIGFFAMAVDEGWSFHERLNGPVRALLGGSRLGVFYYGWVLPALLAVAALGSLFLGFLWRLPPATRRAFLLAGTVYVGGAVGLELIEGLRDEVHGDRNLSSGLLGTLQEAMEMTGAILFIRALLGHLAISTPDVRLRFSASAVPLAVSEEVRRAG